MTKIRRWNIKQRRKIKHKLYETSHNSSMCTVCAIFDYSSYLPIDVEAQSTWGGITGQAIFAVFHRQPNEAYKEKVWHAMHTQAVSWRRVITFIVLKPRSAASTSAEATGIVSTVPFNSTSSSGIRDRPPWSIKSWKPFSPFLSRC